MRGKNMLDGNNSRLDTAKENIIEFRIIAIQTTQNEAQREKKRVGKNVQRISEVWRNFKQPNICVITVPEREKRKS